jgi:hypothetical protein
MWKKLLMFATIISTLTQTAMPASRSRNSFSTQASRLYNQRILNERRAQNELRAVAVLSQQILNQRDFVLSFDDEVLTVNSSEAQRLLDLVESYLERLNSMQDLQGIDTGINYSHEAGILQAELDALLRKSQADLEQAIRSGMTSVTGVEIATIIGGAIMLGGYVYSEYLDYVNDQEKIEELESDIESASEAADLAEDVEDKICEDEDEDEEGEFSDDIIAEKDVPMFMDKKFIEVMNSYRRYSSIQYLVEESFLKMDTRNFNPRDFVSHFVSEMDSIRTFALGTGSSFSSTSNSMSSVLESQTISFFSSFLDSSYEDSSEEYEYSDNGIVAEKDAGGTTSIISILEIQAKVMKSLFIK